MARVNVEAPVAERALLRAASKRGRSVADHLQDVVDQEVSEARLLEAQEVAKAYLSANPGIQNAVRNSLGL